MQDISLIKTQLFQEPKTPKNTLGGTKPKWNLLMPLAIHKQSLQKKAIHIPKTSIPHTANKFSL
jgi:hypothetical protein